MNEPTNDSNPLDALPSSGVEALIERLRDEGVASGRVEAEQLVAEARHEAERTLAEAHAQAEEILLKARNEAQRFREAGEEALHSAMRDAVLKMKGQLSTRFSQQIKRLVSTDMAQEAFLEKLILELAGRVRRDAALDESEKLQLLLPEDVVGLEQLRNDPEQLREGSLSHFVLSVASELLRDGVELHGSRDLESGIRICLNDGEIQVDLTPQKVAAVLLEHLHPRFRAILEGTVK
jgi:V/A-type H+/Na+-transporting ATPase subunit E